MREPVKLPLSHPMVSRIIGVSFGVGRSRRPVRVECRSSGHYNPSWDGGSKTDARFVKLDIMSVLRLEDVPHEKRSTPFATMVDASVKLTPGICMVEHIIFQGKDLGYRVLMNPTDIPTYLPEAASLIPIEPALRGTRRGAHDEE